MSLISGWNMLYMSLISSLFSLFHYLPLLSLLFIYTRTGIHLSALPCMVVFLLIYTHYYTVVHSTVYNTRSAYLFDAPEIRDYERLAQCYRLHVIVM